MSIKLYTGRMGSGKTYEVVTEVILSAVRRGRRVVSNIAGLDLDAMREFLMAQGVDADELGNIVMVEHSQVVEPLFWRTDKSGTDEPEAFIQPGDLVALDEIWRFWGGMGKVDSEGKKRPASVMNFFRMHRHFTHDVTGVACDVALITQDVLDLSRDVRAVVEETYYMEKLTAVGSSKRYRVDIHQGGKKTRKPLRSIQRRYDPALFPLYSSHSQKKEGGADAVEENIDDRGNILKGAIFKVVLPLAVPIFGFAVWSLYGFFHPAEVKATAIAEQPVNGVELSQSQAAGQAPVVNAPLPVESWRVAGWYDAGGAVRVMLTDGNRTRYVVEPQAIKLTPLSVEVALPEGGFATSWTGGARRPSMMPGQGQ